MRNTARILLAAVLFAVLTATSAFAQCPANLPANTIQGRLGIPAAGGPCQAIPFSRLTQTLIGSQSSNILAYGAVAGDPTQSAVNIAAIRAACAATQNVYVPPGTFYVDAFVWPEFCNVGGAGKDVSILRQPDGQGIGTVSFIQTPVFTWHAHDISFRSAYLVNGAINALYVLFAANVELENVDIFAGVTCLGIDGSTHVTVVNLGCRRYTGRGISSTNPSSFLTFINTQIDPSTGGDQGILLLAPTFVEIRGGYITAPGSWGILFSNDSITFPNVFGHDLLVDGMEIQTTRNELIGFQDSYNITVTKNKLVGLPSTDNGIGIYANDAVADPTRVTSNIVVANNFLSGIGGSGIIVNIAGFVSRASITGNVVLNPAVASNQFESDGIVVVSAQALGARDIIVSGNVVVDEYASTSSSAGVSIGTGAKTLTTPTGQIWGAGITLRLADQANPANWMQGTVTSYSGSTLIMNITSVNGSGTPASWLIGHARSMIAEFVNGDTSGTFTSNVIFEGNTVRGGWAGPSALGGYFIAGATSRAVNGGTLIQGKGDTQKGWRTVNNAGSNYWDTYLDGSATLVFRNLNGNTLNANTNGDLSFTGDLYLKGNHFTSAAGAFTWTMPTISGNVITDNSTNGLTNKSLTSPALSGTVTGNNTIPLSILSQIGANSVAANCTAGTANVTAVQAGAADQVFRVGSGANPCAFGSIDLAKSATVGATILPPANGGTGVANSVNLTVSTATSVGKGQYLGTATNDNATAGNIGEYISSTIAATGVALTRLTPANMTSISLTAGDWDVSCNPIFRTTGTTVVIYFQVGIGTTSATLGTDYVSQSFGTAGQANSAFSDHGMFLGNIRMSLSGTTTVYCVANSEFNTSTLSVYNKMYARRVR